MSSRHAIPQFRWLLALAVLVLGAVAAPLSAQCTLQLSDTGIVRMQSGDERELTWNAVPGATSYLVETLIEGLNEPSGPDFTFGGPYTESRNGEGRGITKYPVRHTVLYKMRFRYTVTALNRGNPSWQPCKADVLYVVEPDLELASIAARRIVPLAGKTPGAGGANYSTALILVGTGQGTYVHPGEEEYHEQNPLYQGKIVFRPLGTKASDTDPSIEYRMHGDQTLVYDDIMDRLGASGVGTIEVIPHAGRPAPMADVIIENRMPDNRKTSVRVQAATGRDLLTRSESVTVAIRNNTDARLSIGVRGLGGPSHGTFQHLRADGTEVEVVHRWLDGDITMVYPLKDLFAGPFQPGDRIDVGWGGMDLRGAEGARFRGAGGVLLFLSETGNDVATPTVIYRDSMSGRRYEDGFDRFVVD